MSATTQLPRMPIGWPFLDAPREGRLAWPTLEESIRASIKIILLTRQGELFMRPLFGADIGDFLHQPNTLVTRRRIRDRIVNALEKWEPRITIDRVDVWESQERKDEVRIEIAYGIKRTGKRAALTVNLTLGG